MTFRIDLDTPDKNWWIKLGNKLVPAIGIFDEQVGEYVAYCVDKKHADKVMNALEFNAHPGRYGYQLKVDDDI